MDAISDNAFTEIGTAEVPVDDPSLLTVILDLTPQSWYSVKDQITLQEVAKSLLVFLNAHLSLNNSNQVAFVVSTANGSKFLYPNPTKEAEKEKSTSPVDGKDQKAQKEPSPSLINKNMYRQFRLVDEAVLEELNEFIDEELEQSETGTTSTLSGALSMVLTYTNRILNLDQSISTTTASAISTTTNSAALGRNGGGGGGSSGGGSGSGSGGGAGGANGGTGSNGTHSTNLTSMKSRVLIITANNESDVNYIPIMNAIFAAQKMRLPIDVAKLGSHNSAYLQQACDTTNGIYLHIENPQGLIQVLCTAYFVEPSIRPLLILPTNANTNYRASCFITGKSVDMGYVCSVCLCIMSFIPSSEKCPTCGSGFDKKILAQLTKGPVVAPRKKRKLPVNGNGNGKTSSPAVGTPEP
ncbi:general transcription and DNA repair factor IIH subunit Tfb4p [[Candida] railenensis]|uniref:General transcription and DNA repair factor IIH subunit TFB4 n=1 Tax=[Candida] railenensis TaxID=45579 RepID=A0A9P0VVV3_9ASCO|nr:general transcription and DNA repair factor IIH subunit Tfb4p [[Candida] railenensis]